jgi:hypothetical protein
MLAPRFHAFSEVRGTCDRILVVTFRLQMADMYQLAKRFGSRGRRLTRLTLKYGNKMF